MTYWFVVWLIETKLLKLEAFGLIGLKKCWEHHNAGFDGQKPLQDRASTSNVGLLYFKLLATCYKLQVYHTTSSFDDDVITKCFNKHDAVVKSKKNADIKNISAAMRYVPIL